MAVDTRDKRFSMLGFAQARGAPIVFTNPDGSDAEDATERAQYVYLYAGIDISTVTGQPYERRLGGTPNTFNKPIIGRSW